MKTIVCYDDNPDYGGHQVMACLAIEALARANDLMKNDEVAFIINPPSGRVSRPDEISIRAEAVVRNVPLVTTISGANALVGGIEEMSRSPLRVRALQDYHSKL